MVRVIGVMDESLHVAVFGECPPVMDRVVRLPPESFYSYSTRIFAQAILLVSFDLTIAEIFGNALNRRMR